MRRATLAVSRRRLCPLRRGIADATSLPVPVTLLYDHQTVHAIAEFLVRLVDKQTEGGVEGEGGAVAGGAAVAAAPTPKKRKLPDIKSRYSRHALKYAPRRPVEDGGEAEEGVAGAEDEEGDEMYKDLTWTAFGWPAAALTEGPEEAAAALEEALRVEEAYAAALAAMEAEEEAERVAAMHAERLRPSSPPPDPYAERDHPSQLLKVVRPAPRQRPFFMAAPGVNSAQAAYFTFVNTYLAVSLLLGALAGVCCLLGARISFRPPPAAVERPACVHPGKAPAAHVGAGADQRARHSFGAAPGALHDRRPQLWWHACG